MAGGARSDDRGRRGTVATVFVSDPTAEAERLAQALRSAGYVVVDVPLSMLVARVAVQHPRVILVDADGDGALDVVSRMRELPDAEDIDVLFVARPGGALASPEQALAHEGSGLFIRPVEIEALVQKVETLTGGAGSPEADDPRTSTPPPSIPGLTKRRSSIPPAPSLPPASSRIPSTGVSETKAASQSLRAGTSRMPSEPPLTAAGGSRRAVGLAHPVSSELQQLLEEAEQRVLTSGDGDSLVPSPEDEIEAVLPAELLAALDGPLEDDEDDDEVLPPARSLRSSPGVREPTNERAMPRTTGAARSGDAAPAASRSETGEAEAPLTPAPPQTHGGTHGGPTGAGHSSASTTGRSEARPRAESSAPSEPEASAQSHAASSLVPATAWSPPVLQGRPVEAPAGGEVASLPVLLGPGDVMRVLAQAVAARRTGFLCMIALDVERRVVLREGDVVTLSSTAEEESLLAFLGTRGDLPKETVRRLGSNFPPFGRHAGAALVARGYLGQDQMWPTLRAHAEWLLGRVLSTPNARLVDEGEPPGRLAGEPSVFGGSTGAEVYVDVVRRVVSPSESVERLGGPGSRVSDGSQSRLLTECALGATELEEVRAMAGRSLREVVAAGPDGDLPTVVFALVQLGVLEILPAVDRVEPAGPGDSAGVAALDEEAIRERVRARMQLVDDGDYFAVLGVTRSATGYEVRRAFIELRRTFDPSRVLTPAVVDLAEDLRRITGVLEEAYDILKDSARRERYRRAIEATPN